MCRFALYLGPTLTLDALVTRPVNSIIHQSFHSHERSEPLNGDGFGLAWYVPALSAEPALFRSITPAWNNRNLRHLAQVTRSDCILAHVRAASPGLPVTETNCHPFASGRLAFMHNGNLGGFARIRRRLRAALSDASYDVIEGTTDSEVLFALFLDHLGAGDPRNPAEAMARALEAAFAQVARTTLEAGIDEVSHLNVAVTDGACAVASRVTTGPPDKAASLYVHEGRRYVCEDGVCRMVQPDEGHGAVLVCSEPLSNDPGWERVPPNHLVLVQSDRSVKVRPAAALPVAGGEP